ncbi:MAG: carboxypeptidase regulatory-like domain-containing protein [Planctomycetes bacterium]|nr:carboxypeptidase regulatory-like domain-containing protein [Planctomycetota bacterium]
MQRTTLVLLAAFVLAGLTGAAWWLTRQKSVVEPIQIDIAAPAAPVEPTSPETQLARTSASDGSFGSLDTTVVFPLEIELELVRGKYVPNAPGAVPLGTGSNAVLKGRIIGPKGEGSSAVIEFVGGTNTGRVLHCDLNGEFGANDLQPGLGIVRVRGRDIIGSQREVLLRQERETLLNISYARTSRAEGVVFDADGKPMTDALVTFDGQEVRTDENGVFSLAFVAPGEALVIVEKPGFSAYRELVTVPFGGRIDKERLQFRLRRAARLQVTVVETINAAQQAWFYILPENDSAQRSFPWHRVNPQRVWPGGTLTIDDLPAGSYSARLFQAGATTTPKVAAVALGPGDTTILEFHLEPAPVIQGVVKDNGRPEPGVIVRLEAPDRTQANLAVFGQTNYMALETDVFPNMPTAVQEAITNAQGEFTLSANESVSAVRYVTAMSKDQKRAAHAVLKPGDTHVELVLVPFVDGKSALRFVTNPRHQALPLKVVVNGAPRELGVAQPGRDILVPELPSGSWLMTVTWHGEPVLKREPIDLDGEVAREIELPEGAIGGQDSSTVQRAGKR